MSLLHRLMTVDYVDVHLIAWLTVAELGLDDELDPKCTLGRVLYITLKSDGHGTWTYMLVLKW